MKNSFGLWRYWMWRSNSVQHLDLKSAQSRVLGCSHGLRIPFQIVERRSQQDQNEDRSLGTMSLDLDERAGPHSSSTQLWQELLGCQHLPLTFRPAFLLWLNSVRKYGRLFREDVPLKQGIFTPTELYLGIIPCHCKFGEGYQGVTLTCEFGINVGKRLETKSCRGRSSDADGHQPGFLQRREYQRWPYQDCKSKMRLKASKNMGKGRVWSFWSENDVWIHLWSNKMQNIFGKGNKVGVNVLFFKLLMIRI